MNSLLRSLLTDHLDPGYAIAAERNKAGQPRTAVLWLTVGAVVLGLIFGVALTNNADVPGGAAESREIVTRIHEAQDAGVELSDKRDSLAAQTDSAREAALAGNADGAELLTKIDTLEAAAGVQAVHGPGVAVTLRDGTTKGRSIVLDLDIQAVVNALWASGAEAVSVGGVRIGPSVTIRHAGGAVLVDNGPVFSPYKIVAIGSPQQLQTGFVVSEAFVRMSGLSQLYGVGFDYDVSEDLSVPAAPVRELRVAHEGGR